MADATIGAMVLRRIQESGPRPALRAKKNGSWSDTSWTQLGKRMEAIAAGLLTIPGGLEDHAAVSIHGNTSEEWIATDFAALTVGLRTVPVYATLLPEEAGYLLVDTEAVVAVVEDAAQLAKVRELRGGFTFFDRKYPAEDVKLKHVVVMDPTGVDPADDWESLADLEKRGNENLEATAEERKKRGVGQREDTATYTYTSGTTGPPKGVIQTNDNMLSMMEAVAKTGIMGAEMREGGFDLFLPLAHSFGRLIELSGPYFDAPIIMSGIPTLADDLKETRPGFFPAAPRVYEKIKAKIETAVAGAPPIRQKLFHFAMNTGKKTIPYRSQGKAIPLPLKLRYKVADKLVLSKLRAKLGFDRCHILLSGSAPLNVEVHEFFLAAGLNLLEAYGLTETCPGLTTNLPDSFKLGTVGKAFPGVTIKIADDGEILAKGPNITAGYLNRDEATTDAFDADGWFMTGDLGSMDSDGFVKITGRKKELMKTSGGKYIAPAKLEGRIKNLPIIQECVTVADTRNYVTALVAIDPEELEEWSKQTGHPNDLNAPEVLASVEAHIETVNKTLAKYETVKYVRIVEPMTVENGILTASLKVKRKVVYERYASLIDEMYSTGKKPGA